MIDAPEELTPLLRDFAYVLHDLGEIEPERLSETPELRAGLLALRVVHFEEVPGELLDLIVGGPLAGSAYERHIIRYVVEGMNLTPDRLEASLRRTRPDRWETLMGTVAEAWIEQGRAEGIEKGRSEGRQEGREEGRAAALEGLLLRQLELRFGVLPEGILARVRGASACGAGSLGGGGTDRGERRRGDARRRRRLNRGSRIRRRRHLFGRTGFHGDARRQARSRPVQRVATPNPVAAGANFASSCSPSAPQTGNRLGRKRA